MTANIDNILKELKTREKEEGNLPLLLRFYREILQIQAAVAKSLAAPEISVSREDLLKRQQQGKPLLAFDDIRIDWVLARDAFVKIRAVFSRYPSLFGELPENKRRFTKAAFKAWYTGKELPAMLCEGIGENVLRAVIQATVLPFISNYAMFLGGLVDQEYWRRGYCPVCGGSPDLAYLEKEVGGRWLLCSRCDFEWQFQRLECPYCGNKEQKSLSFYTDEKDLYRLYVCDGCRSYLKAIDLRKTEGDIEIHLERLETIHLDTQAKEYGYNPA